MKAGDLVQLRTFKDQYPPDFPRLATVLRMHTGRGGRIVGVTVMWDEGSVSTLATPDFLEVISDNTILD